MIRKADGVTKWVSPSVLGPIFLVLLGILSAVPVFASGAEPSKEHLPPAGEPISLEAGEGASPVSGSGREIVAKRTADSDTYALPDGERETRLYQAPVNYRNAEGEWVPIEEGFKRVGLGIEDRNHRFEVHLPGQLGDGPVRLGDGDHWISFELEGQESRQAEVEGSGAVAYEVPGAGTSFEYSTLPGGVKESIDLSGPSSPSTYHYLLSLAAGIRPELAKDGSIYFREKAGNFVAVMPAPTVSDSSSPLPDPRAVSYSLTPMQGGSWDLALEVERAWLEQPGRSWPVEVDPTLLAETPVNYGCMLWSSEPETTYCGNGQLGVASGHLPVVRSILNFNWGELNLPAGAEIKEASVNLDAMTGAENVEGVEIRRLISPWNAYTATWNCAYVESGLCHRWTTPGGDFSSEGSELLTKERAGQGAWWSFDKGLVPILASWREGALGAGLILKLNDESTGASDPSRLLVWLDETYQPSTRPYVRVGYLPKAPKTSQLAFPTEGTTTAGRLRLKAKWGEEGSVSGVTFEYRTNPKEKGAFKPIPPELVSQADGEPVKEWPIHSSLFEPSGFQTKTLYVDAAHVASKLQEEGGAIDVRAVFEGTAAVQGYSEPVEAIVNRITGSAHDATAEVGPGTLDLETGNLSISRTDVSIPGFESALEFGRTYDSRAPRPVTEAEKAEPPGVLGPGWKTGIPVEEAGGSEFRDVRMVVHSGEYEEEVGESCKIVVEGTEEVEVCEPEIVKVPYRFAWAVVTADEGGELPFEEGPGGTFVTPPELTGWKLVKNPEGNFVLSDPSGDVTTFKTVGGGEEYLPSSVNQPGGAGNTTRLTWEFKNGEKQLKKLIAPSPPGLSCVEVEATGPAGCHALEFTYGPVGSGAERLKSIKYLAPGNLAAASEVASYEYTYEGQLIGEWDPRISPPLKEQYAYGANGQLKEVIPPGQKPWTLEYGTVDKEAGVGRLIALRRASLLTSPTEAQTTIAYGVPISGGTAPYQMGGSEVGQWGQTDLPVEATAIFPPSEVPASPPTSWAQATIYYMDSEGHAVNTATPKGGGTSEPSISTAEPNEYGDIVRELSPDNRLAVLREPEANRKERWEALETRRRYTEEGTQMVEELGPMHPVRIAEGSGEVAKARLQKVVEYDYGWPGTGVKPHLPTLETTEATNPNWGVKDKRETETHYNWNLRKPTETIVDPGVAHLDIKHVTVYEEGTGLPIEVRQPKAADSAEPTQNPGTTKTLYYGPGAPSPCTSSAYAGLPCEILPAGQTSGAGRPELLVKRIASYDALEEPTELVETPGVGTETRTTKTTYDKAGRELTAKVEGGGAAIPKTETLYSPTLGLPERQQFVCASSECPSGSTYQDFAYQSSFGSKGTGNGQLESPAGLALDPSGNLWVADSENNRLQEFNAKGEFLRAIGSKGSGNGQFASPQDVAIGGAGSLFVADTANNRIEKFNSSGEFVGAFGSKGSGNGQLEDPDSIAVANGHVWVADGYNHRLDEFTEAGEFIKAVGSGILKVPIGVATGPEEGVWVAEGGHIVEFSESGSLVRVIVTEADAIEVDRDGDVFVTAARGRHIEEFGQKGEFIGQFGTAGSGPGQFEAPTGIVADAAGDLWVSDGHEDRVQKWSGTPANLEATNTDYNALGQVTQYEDADGNMTEIHYEIDGRPVTVSDDKGTQTYHYNETSGLLTSLEDSGAGTFTASYDADGNMIERGLPNGLTAKTSYNAVDEPTRLAYTKTSSCGESCTWYEEELERSVYGQILTDGNTLATDRYKYDNAGRLAEAQETPTGGGCTSRAYEYDADSNRLSRRVREPGIGGACVTSGGTEQEYSYDEADRLMGTDLTYDAWGRITNLPAEYAGGTPLETKYFGSNMVASQTQNGVTNSYELDAGGRQHQRIQAGGVAGTEVFHYDGPGDSPAWTALGSTWSRNVIGIGGELAAVQESSGTTTFDLTDVHGDVVATASSSPTATKLLATYRFDEFGEPQSGSAGRFGWLGGKSRRTELSSGVIQMGARSYIPQLGRFLTPDPVRGGSANAYDYADQDPVNGLDLNGEKNCINVGRPNEACGKTASELKAAARRANKTGRIHIAFASRQDARHFENYLATHSASKWVGDLNLKAGEIHAAQLYKLEKKAQEISAHEVVVSGGASTCASLSSAAATGGVGLSLALLPAPAASATAGAVTGVVSWGLGVLSAAGVC
ncbi:MAG: DNRLRE domain-containing protein [Actinobacteria bacterium]|nr:DNRLRE domain-containing protein [Actinomycetota bacterium]